VPTQPPPPPSPTAPHQWLPDFWDLSQRRLRPQARLLFLALLTGVVTGLGAIAFHVTCQFVTHYPLAGLAGYRPSTPGGEPSLLAEPLTPFRPWLLLLVPTVGGLLAGMLVFRLAPEAEGHGTDAAIASFHYRQGSIRPRVPLVKLFASALTIGTGGSGGREGPIAQIGAGFGSFVANLFRMAPGDRRLLMASGMGAGVAAIFRAPLAGALFAAEVLYCSADFEAEVIVPAALASTTAYCTFGAVFGWEPLFSIPVSLQRSLTFSEPRQLIAYSLLALLLVVLAMLYTRSFYGLSHLFRRLPLPRAAKAGLGAMATGAVGLLLYAGFRGDARVLSVLSFGYGSLQDALVPAGSPGGTLSLAAILIAVALGKILTTGLTIGSGGSGGVFGPSMVIGGCGGGALGVVLHHYWPSLVPQPASFVIVGMAGFFAAAAKTPLSTLIIVSEMTGSYSLLLPTLWVCMLTFLLSDEQSLYHSQLRSRSLSPAHQGDYVREVLSGTRLADFLVPPIKAAPLRPGAPLAVALSRLAEAPGQCDLAVADTDDRYLGILGLAEVHPAVELARFGRVVVVADLMRGDVPALSLDDTVDRALELFVAHDRAALAVVEPGPGRRVLGLVRRADLAATYLHRLQGAPLPPSASAPTTPGTDPGT